MEKKLQAQETPEQRFDLIKQGRKYFNPIIGLFYDENATLRFDTTSYLTTCEYISLRRLLPVDCFRKIRVGKYKLRL